MGRFMNMITGILYHRHHQRIERTVKAQQVHDLTEETTAEVAKLRHRVAELSQADDPLAELMRTLRPKKSRRHGDA